MTSGPKRYSWWIFSSLLLAGSAHAGTVLVEVRWDLTICLPLCGGCCTAPGSHEDEALRFRLVMHPVTGGGSAVWDESGLTQADIGTVYAADGPTLAALAEMLTNGIPGLFGNGEIIDVGYGLSGSAGLCLFGSSEASIFGGLDFPDIDSEVYVPPPNGIDYQSYAIDAVTMRLDALCLAYDANLDRTEMAATFFVTFSGRAGDLDGDNAVGVVDLLALLGAFGPCPGPDPCLADFNGSGAVDVPDLLTILGNWG